MDRKTAFVLVVAIVLMIGAGIGLLFLMRKLEVGKTSVEPPEGLAESYVKEVEERCGRRYNRPVPGGGKPTQGASAGFYLEAMELMPELSESEWAQIMDDVIVDSWNGGSPPLPPAVNEFGPAVSTVMEGASRTDGRSPYAFCARDTDVEVLVRYRRLARAMELVAKNKVQSGNEKAGAFLLSATIQMEMDLGRGGGVIGHAVTLSMVQDTVTHAIAHYAEVARDPDAIRDLIGYLAMLESSWIDFKDNVRLDGLVEETRYASCFMPPGWEPPVGPPVMTSEEQESLCAMGPDVTGSMWQATRDRSMKYVEALEVPTTHQRYVALLAVENKAEETPVWLKVLQPEKLLADLAAPSYVSPRFLDDIHGHTLVVLARAMLSFRLLALEAGSLPTTMDETSWSGLHDAGRPLREPWSGERPHYELRGESVVLTSTTTIKDWIAPALSARVGSHLDAP